MGKISFHRKRGLKREGKERREGGIPLVVSRRKEPWRGKVHFNRSRWGGVYLIK